MKDETSEVIEPELILSEEEMKDFSKEQKKKFTRASIQLKRPFFGRFIALLFLFLFIPITFFVLFFSLISTVMAMLKIGKNKTLNTQTIGAWKAVIALLGVGAACIVGVINPVWGIRAGAYWIFQILR